MRIDYSRVLMIASGLIAVFLSGFVPDTRVQGAEATGLRFDVASIRPAASPEEIFAALRAGKPPRIGTRIDADRVTIGDIALVQLIGTAYSVRFDQISAPDWLTSMGTPRFEILAKLPPGATAKQLPEMLRALLEERFKLTVHRENRLDPVYALVQEPKGHKLGPAIADEQFARGEGETLSLRDQIAGGMVVSRTGEFAPSRSSTRNGVQRTEYAHITTTQLARILNSWLQRPVTDLTGLQGIFHVILDRDMSDLTVGDSTNSNSPPTAMDRSAWVFSTVRKLGLKLEPRKDYVEHIVIDHIEKEPTTN